VILAKKVKAYSNKKLFRILYNFFTVGQKLYESNSVHPYSSHMLFQHYQEHGKRGLGDHTITNKRKQTNKQTS